MKLNIPFFSSSGLLYDATASYDSGFYFAGLTIFVSGVMLFALPAIQRREREKKRKQQQQSQL